MKKSVVVLLAAGLFTTAHAGDGDPAEGESKAAMCAACHGADGIGLAPNYPNLAGQKAQYLEVQLKAFRDGKRENVIMAPQAASLSDQDIADIAAYYAAMDIP